MSDNIKTAIAATKTIVIPGRRHHCLELSREDLTRILRKAGIPIPEDVRASVQDPGYRGGFEDAPKDAPIEIRWTTE